MQCVMRCMIVHEWNVRAFFFWIFFSFFVLTNAKCKCHMRMPWLDLPMRYATNVPLYQSSMNANKMWCKSRYFISNANAFFFLQGCRCPMQGCRCKVDPWWCQRTYLTVMQMSFCRNGDANAFQWVCHDANVLL